MLSRLPKLIDPLLLADRNATIEGRLLLGSFERTVDLLFDDTGYVDLKLVFGKEGRLVTVEGQLSAILALKCQRCLGSLAWHINNDIKLGVVNTPAQANNLPDGYEPLLLSEEGGIPLKNLIEDELLLCLPGIPKHEDNCVLPDISDNKPEPLPNMARPATKNPFSILADLKKLEANNGSTKE